MALPEVAEDTCPNFLLSFEAIEHGVLLENFEHSSDQNRQPTGLEKEAASLETFAISSPNQGHIARLLTSSNLVTRCRTDRPTLTLGSSHNQHQHHQLN